MQSQSHCLLLYAYIRQRMGGAVLLNRGSAVLRRCTFVGNKAGVRPCRFKGALPYPSLIPIYIPTPPHAQRQNQGGALFVNASRHAESEPPPPSLPPTNRTNPLPGAFVQDCAFQGNGVTGFPAPYYTFSYPFGGGALAVWGRLLVHNSSFLDNVPPVRWLWKRHDATLTHTTQQASRSHTYPRPMTYDPTPQPGAAANGSVAHVDGEGVLQLAFCSFAARAGRQRLGLRPGDLHLATPTAATRCLGTHAGAAAAAAGAGAPQCLVGPAGGAPWAAPVLFLLLGLPLSFTVYLLALAASSSTAQRWQQGGLAVAGEGESDDEEYEKTALMRSGGYDPASTFPIPPSGSAAMWRFIRGRRHPRRRSSSSSSSSSSTQQLAGLQRDGSGSSGSTLTESEQQEEGSEEDSGERTDKGQEGSDWGSNIEGEAEEAATVDARGDGGSGSGIAKGAGKEEEDGDVLDWPTTRAYRLSLGAELRDPSRPSELEANHLEAFTLEGRGRNVFQVTDPQPVAHSRFGRLYFARNAGVGGQPPCLMLVYNRFKHEAATLVTEKELLHTGSSSASPFLLRHLDDFFHERVGYYVALTPCCRETLHQRLCRAIGAPHDPAHALDFFTCARYLHEILQGLGALRDLRMVHGRLSLNAVLLTPDDHVRLWDYGVPSTAAVRRPDKPTAYAAPEVWDMLRMNPSPVSSMDSWSAGVVGYMLAAKALTVTLPACAPRYRAETYVDYFREYLEGQRGRRTGLHAPTAPPPEPYFPSLPSVDPAFRAQDRRDHGGALVRVLGGQLDVNANRRLPLAAAEAEVRQIVQRAVLLGRSSGDGCVVGVVVKEGGGEAAAGGGSGGGGK